MIYLPLLLLGVERILQERRPTLLMVTVWMAALTNFYFFYMLAILTAIYGICRVMAIHLGGVLALAGLLLMIGIIFYDHAWIAAKNARRRCKIH